MKYSYEMKAAPRRDLRPMFMTAKVYT